MIHASLVLEYESVEKSLEMYLMNWFQCIGLFPYCIIHHYISLTFLAKVIDLLITVTQPPLYHNTYNVLRRRSFQVAVVLNSSLSRDYLTSFLLSSTSSSWLYQQVCVLL